VTKADVAELVDARDLKSLPPNQIIDDFWKTRGLDPMEINGTKRVLENAPLSSKNVFSALRTSRIEKSPATHRARFSSGARTADIGHPSCGSYSMMPLALQLRFLRASESMGNHDSKIVDADSVD
jgi:hypothetical protein